MQLSSVQMQTCRNALEKLSDVLTTCSGRLHQSLQARTLQCDMLLALLSALDHNYPKTGNGKRKCSTIPPPTSTCVTCLHKASAAKRKMVIVVCLLGLLSLFSLTAEAGAPSPPKYDVLYIEQKVDHFNFELHDTFMERYFLSGKFCN